MITVRKYTIDDENALMELIENEGADWECYYGKEVNQKYRNSLKNSITYIAFYDNTLCGYSRSIDDNGFYIYVCDLLVDKRFRGHGIGKKLMDCVIKDYPEQTVYVMSDVDEYYEKQGYKKEGSVFEVIL